MLLKECVQLVYIQLSYFLMPAVKNEMHAFREPHMQVPHAVIIPMLDVNYGLTLLCTDKRVDKVHILQEMLI